MKGGGERNIRIANINNFVANRQCTRYKTNAKVSIYSNIYFLPFKTRGMAFPENKSNREFALKLCRNSN